MLKTFNAAAAITLFAVNMFGQTATPAFDVATIKPAAPFSPVTLAANKIRLGMTIDASRVTIGSLSLADVIRIAYRVKSYQVTGPDWITTERFDVVAKMPEGATKEQVPEMLQALLADRFKLTIRHESREHAMYALVVGKNGPKLKEAVPDPDTPAVGQVGQVTVSGDGKGVSVAGSPVGPMRMTMGPSGNMHMEASKTTLGGLADLLSRLVDRPVVDMTELKGTYQIGLDLSMEDLRNMAKAAGMTIPGQMPGGDAGKGPADAASDPANASVFQNIQQLGLKLEPRKSQVDMIVVEHAEKVPTEN